MGLCGEEPATGVGPGMVTAVGELIPPAPHP